MPADRAARILRPIVVLGAPRSGTTFLTSVLGAHPDVAVVGEPRLVWRYGNDARSDELGPEHATPRVVDHIHRRLAAELAGHGGGRLVEKTPANAVRPRFVGAVFPDACYVHVTRNGWAAVPSMRQFWERRASGFDAKQVAKLRRRIREARPSQLRFYTHELWRRAVTGRHVPLYGPRLAGLQQVADEHGCLIAAAVQWRACVERASAFGRALPRGRYVEVRLETLGPGDVAAILEVCGLRPSPEVLDRFRRSYRVEEARRREPLSGPERDLLAPYVLPSNAWLGYDEVPVVLPAGPSGPVRAEDMRRSAGRAGD